MNFLLNTWCGQVILPPLTAFILVTYYSLTERKPGFIGSGVFLAILWFSIHRLSAEVFGISFLPFVIFAFSAYGFIRILTVVLYEKRFMAAAFFRRYFLLWDMLSVGVFSVAAIMQVARIINTVI